MTEIEADNADALIVRHNVSQNHTLSLLPEIYVERGTIQDWETFHELHYKAETVGIGPRFFRIMLRDEPIGVGVMTVPKMLLAGRNEVFKHLRPNVDGKDNSMINKYRAEWLNANACTNSRLVIDTMYRGAGIAYRAQNIMMRMTNLPIIEFQSSMSRFNPFAYKAGIRFAPPRKATNYQRGLNFFRKWFETQPFDYVGIKEELEVMPEAVRKKCVAEMRHFYYQYSSMEKSGNNRMNGTDRVENLPVDKLIKNAQQLAFASPMYGFYKNPDAVVIRPKGKRADSILPSKIPIMAFDNQATDEPLNLSKLEGLTFDFN